MTSMKDSIQVEVTGDADAVTSELYVENTIENPTWYAVEDNHVSLVSENTEKVIKLEIDLLDDCMWGSRIEITKDVDYQSNMELPLECQDVADNNIYLNHGNTSDNIFHCNICGKSFALNYLLKNHLAEHKRQVHYKTNKCKFCGKQFKLQFGLNRHIQKHHNAMYKCRSCKHFIDCSKYTEHKKFHERRDSIVSIVREPTTSRDVTRENSSDHTRLVNSNSTIVTNASQNSMENNYHILNIKQEKDLYTNVRERKSSDQVDSVNNNKSTLANEPRDFMAEQYPFNNNILSIVRDAPYFCIRKLPNIKNGFGNHDYDQASQNNVIFICRICKNSPSTDIHSFALHMCDHRECNMHECIVCDTTFNSVVLWTAHMTYHQQQMDLNVSTVLLETEYNTFDPINPRKNVFPKIKVKSAPSQNKNNIVEVNDEPQIEHCNGFEIIHSPVDVNSSGTNLTDIGHLWFPCDVCEQKFYTPFQLNVHRKSHSGIVPYVCKICNRSYQLKFRWNSHLKVHYKTHNSNLKRKQYTNNLKSNISNQKIESISHKDKIKCRYCKKEYNLISQWKKHMSMSKECRRHRKSYLPEFTSKKAVLDKTYLNTYDNTGLQKDKLMDTVQQKPAIKKRNRSNHVNGAKCELCGKLYYNGANLSRHISIIHAQTHQPTTCNVCGSTFKHEFSYREHLKTKHKRLYKDYEESDSAYYKRASKQILSVNKKNKYICEVCKIKFADNITLQKHTKIHTLNMYKCNDCGQQYETNLSLGNHIWENHSANISTSNKN